MNIEGALMEGQLRKHTRRFERVIVVALMLMMAVVVLLSTIELGRDIIEDIAAPPTLLIDINNLLEIFGLFLLIMIGIELLETIKSFVLDNVFRVEVVLLVAIIAIARKVIILDINNLPSLTLLGIAAIIIALTAGYYLVRRTHKETQCNL
ncbi:MAG: phosphate-starvation-inducible PsiE family protein [Chloroflexota bacterium]|nr:phosphate-starvation-inducible PsiE family protein [Chloroflexota bacterium]